MKNSHILLSIAFSASAFALSAFSASDFFKSAEQAENSGSGTEALALYLKADSAYVAENLAGSGDFALSLHHTGRAYFNAGDISAGREYTRKAMELREKLFGKVSKEYLTSLNNYALSFLMADEPGEALKYQTEVVGLCRKMDPPHPDEGMYIINLGRAYHALGNEGKAVECMEEALGKVEKFSSNYEYILNFLGSAYMELGDNAAMNRILGLMEEHNRRELTKPCDAPDCHLERARYFMSAGEPSNAKDEFNSLFAMELSDEEKTDAYATYARFLMNERDFASAGDYLTMASEASVRDLGENESATSLVSRAGLCYFIGKEYDKSIASHLRAIEDVDARGYSPKIKTTSLQGIGNAYSGKKEYGKAAKYFRMLIGHLEDIGQEEGDDYPKAYERLASAEKFSGDYDRSIKDYNTAIGLYEKLGKYDEAEQAKAGLTLCMAYARQYTEAGPGSNAAQAQREDKLRKILRESLDALEQSGGYLGKLSTARSLATIAGCYAQLGDYTNAVGYYSRYIPAIREALAEDFLLKNPAERERTWRPELSNISEMNAMLAKLPDNPELFARLVSLIYEGQLLSKGILLSSNIEFEKILAKRGTEDMRSLYRDIRTKLVQLDEMRQTQAPLDSILALSRATDASQLELARQSAGCGDFMNYLRTTAADVLEALPDDAAAIEFVTIDTDILSDGDLVAAFVLSKEFPTGLVLPLGSVKDIKTIIADPQKFDKNEYGATIWGNILGAIPEKKKIYFAPDGVLNNIGIEYLSVDGLPLSERLEVSRLSSTRELTAKHTPTPLLYAALFGDIDYIGDAEKVSDKRKYSLTRESDGLSFSQLGNTGREIREIGKILKKHTKKTFPYTGTKASKGEFLSQDEIPVGLLHIATHGKYIDDEKSGSDAMDRSILAFAGANMYGGLKDNEGIVTAAEIAGMSLHDCRLAVLSACESGLGKLGSDGVFGLQRGFKNAGVRSLLVSLNEVADATTADMMIAFYRHLFSSEGITVHEALRSAQAEIRATHPGDRTWASFILIDALD